MNRPTDPDDSIPVLTQRAPARHAPPLLSEQVFPGESHESSSWPSAPHSAGPASESRLASFNQTPDYLEPDQASLPQAYAATQSTYAPNRSNAPSSPADTVLRATLQAAIEEAVQEALDEAMVQVKLRLEARLPEIVARAMQSTRSG